MGAVVLAVAAAWCAIDGRWLARLVPHQEPLLAALLPEFALQLHLHDHAGQRVLAARAESLEYLVLRGRAWPPGLHLTAHTPARQTQRNAAVLFGGAALLCRQRGLRRVRAWLLLLSGGAGLLLGFVPVVLAGQMWGLVVDGMGELSLPAWLVPLSDLLLQGGDLALCIVLLGLVAAADGPRGMVRSDHGRAWSGRTMHDPAGEGRASGPATPQ